MSHPYRTAPETAPAKKEPTVLHFSERHPTRGDLTEYRAVRSTHKVRSKMSGAVIKYAAWIIEQRHDDALGGVSWREVAKTDPESVHLARSHGGPHAALLAALLDHLGGAP